MFVNGLCGDAKLWTNPCRRARSLHHGGRTSHQHHVLGLPVCIAYGRLAVDALQGTECGHDHRADGSVIFGLARPLVGGPSLMFALFGIAFAIATPAIVSLPAQILRPCNRATGFGIYYIWYYAGSAPLPPVGGFLKDVTGTATAAVLFSASMMFGTGVFALGASGLRDARSVHALYSAARVRKWPLATMHDPCFVVRLSG